MKSVFRILPAAVLAVGLALAGPQAAAMGAKCTSPSLPAGAEDGWVEVVNRAINSNVLK